MVGVTMMTFAVMEKEKSEVNSLALFPFRRVVEYDLFPIYNYYITTKGRSFLWIGTS